MRINELIDRFVQVLPHKRVWPRQLVDYRRFDIAAKTIFARAYLDGNTAKWPEKLYKEHLFVWNGFSERRPRKSSFSDYRNAFAEILDSMRDGNFRFVDHPVPVTLKGQLFDGAHRVSAAIVLNKHLYANLRAIEIDMYNYLYFKNRTVHRRAGLATRYMDAMACEYIDIHPGRLYVAVFFPKANNTIDESERMIRQDCSIVYAKKDIDISSQGKYNLVHQLYAGEPWNRRDNESAVRHKADACFGTHGGKIRVYLLETKKSHKAMVRLKSNLRTLYGSGKHSVHITDTKQEAQLAAGMFFNDNSLHLINHAKDWKLPERFEDLFTQYRKLGYPNQNRAVDASASMAVYGLRDARDLDYLHRGNEASIADVPGTISSHNEHANHYPASIDEMITDPGNFFYYRGYKFVSLGVVYQMKKARGEQKDKNDCRLIEEVL